MNIILLKNKGIGFDKAYLNKSKYIYTKTVFVKMLIFKTQNLSFIVIPYLVLVDILISLLFKGEKPFGHRHKKKRGRGEGK